MKISNALRIGAILSSICLCTLQADRAFGGTIAISPQDFSNQVRLYDETGVLLDSFALASGAVHDLEFDATTGDVYAFAGFGGTIERLAAGDSAFQALFTTGFVNLNSGADVAVNDSIVAISPNDNTNQVRLFDAVGATLGTFSAIGPVHDLVFDAVNGDLYAFAGFNGAVQRLEAGDSAFQTLFTTSFVNLNSGADIAVNDGVIAISPQDFSNQVRLFDTLGSSLGTFGLTSGAVHDLAYDQALAGLYALAGFNGTVELLPAGGSSFQHLFATGFTNLNSGADIAAFSPVDLPVPEPSTFFLLGTGLIGLVGYARRKNKQSRFGSRNAKTDD